MRKLIMWNVITLDGYFEGEKKWDLSFHGRVWCKEFEELILAQLKTADTLVFGATTYKGMAEYWTKAGEEEAEVATLMNSTQKIVCSRTLTTADWNNTTIVHDAVAEISHMKQTGHGNMFVFGSGNLSESLLKAELFDEIRLCVAPILLGSGNHLFPEGISSTKLKLLEVRPLETGGVILRYATNEKREQ